MEISQYDEVYTNLHTARAALASYQLALDNPHSAMNRNDVDYLVSDVISKLSNAIKSIEADSAA